MATTCVKTMSLKFERKEFPGGHNNPFISDTSITFWIRKGENCRKGLGNLGLDFTFT